jgi:hypothetical protein
MERDKTTYIKPSDLLFASRRNGTAIPADGPMKNDSTLDATKSNNGKQSTMQETDQVDSDAQPSDAPESVSPPVELPVATHMMAPPLYLFRVC